MADRQPSPPTTTDLGMATGSTANNVLLEQLYRDKVALQRQLDDERRLRREAEDIIDQRQDEVAERDAQLRELRAKLGKGGGRLKSSSRSPTSPGRESSGSERTSGERLSRDNIDNDNERRRSGSSTKRKPLPTTATAATTTTTTTTTLPIVLASPADSGLTKPQAMAAYAAIIASVKSFVEARLAPVFALPTRDLEVAVAAVHAATSATGDTPTAPGGGSTTYYTMSRPRALLKLMSPRARMFLRLKGADSVHFYAILMEFLRRRVFAEPYAGVFKTAAGPLPPLPIATATPPTPTEAKVIKEWLLSEKSRRPVNKVEARLTEADELAARLGALLDDVDPAYTGPPVPWGPSTPTATTPTAVLSTSPSTSAGSLGTSTTRQETTRPRHQHSVSDGAAPSLRPRPSLLRHEARLLRVQLLDRILAGNVSSSPPSASSSSPLSTRIAGLSSYIDAHVRQLSADLARVLLPLQLALDFSKRSMADTPAAPDLSDPSAPPMAAAAAALYAREAVDHRAVTYATLERAVATDLVRPAVELAVALQLAVPVYAVRWVEHAHDSPSLSVCEALGLDYQRIQFGGSGGSGGDEDQYSFVFDISPALFMSDTTSEAKPTKVSDNDTDADADTIIYAQGVLLQKGEVRTERTFVHWLHETGVKPKEPKGGSNSVPSSWRRKTSGTDRDDRR